MRRAKMSKRVEKLAIYGVMPLCWASLLFMNWKSASMGRGIAYETTIRTYLRVFSPILPAFGAVVYTDSQKDRTSKHLASKYFKQYSDQELYSLH